MLANSWFFVPKYLCCSPVETFLFRTSFTLNARGLQSMRVEYVCKGEQPSILFNMLLIQFFSFSRNKPPQPTNEANWTKKPCRQVQQARQISSSGTHSFFCYLVFFGIRKKTVLILLKKGMKCSHVIAKLLEVETSWGTLMPVVGRSVCHNYTSSASIGELV